MNFEYVLQNLKYFVWLNFFKKDVHLFNKLVWWKTFNQNFESPHKKENNKIKLQMNEHDMFLQHVLVLVHWYVSCL